MPDSMLAWIYLRKSRDKAELADPDVLHKHRHELLRLAADAGHQVHADRIFEEIGSGERLRSRPRCRALLEALDQLPRGHGGALWTTEVSRFTRGDLADRARVFKSLSRAAVSHWTRGGVYDLNDSAKLMQWEILTTVAHNELGTYKDRVQGAWLEMALEARLPTGQVPFGWIWDRNARNRDGSKGKPVPDPVKFSIVVAICAEAMDISTYALAKKYHVPQMTVCNLLRNPFVCGWPARRHFPHHGERVRRDNGEEWVNTSARVGQDRWIWPKQPGDYEPACTREHWEAIQQILDRRREHRPKPHAANSWCRDVVRFDGETGRIRLGTFVGAAGLSVPSYELGMPDGVHTPYYVAREPVHDAVWAVVSGLLARPAVLRDGIETYQASRQADHAAPNLAGLEMEVSRLSRLLDALLDRELRAADEGDAREVESCTRQRAAYKRELAAAEDRLKAVASASPADPGLDGLSDLLRRVNHDLLAEVWDTIPPNDRRKVVNGFVEVVPVRVEPVGRGRWRREVRPAILKRLWRDRCP